MLRFDGSKYKFGHIHPESKNQTENKVLFGFGSCQLY